METEKVMNSLHTWKEKKIEIKYLWFEINLNWIQKKKEEKDYCRGTSRARVNAAITRAASLEAKYCTMALGQKVIFLLTLHSPGVDFLKPKLSLRNGLLY